MGPPPQQQLTRSRSLPFSKKNQSPSPHEESSYNEDDDDEEDEENDNHHNSVKENEETNQQYRKHERVPSKGEEQRGSMMSTEEELLATNSSSAASVIMDGVMMATARRDSDWIQQLISSETKALHLLRILIGLVLMAGIAAGLSGILDQDIQLYPYMLLLSLSILLLALFGLYDYIATRQLQIVMDTAIKSAAVASSAVVLPRLSNKANTTTTTTTNTSTASKINNIHDRDGSGSSIMMMMNGDVAAVSMTSSTHDSNHEENNTSNSNRRLPDISESEGRSMEAFISPGLTRHLPSTKKIRLKTLLKTELSDSTTAPPSSSSMTPPATTNAATTTSSLSTAASLTGMNGTGVATTASIAIAGSATQTMYNNTMDATPIADFFPHCTVMFADIAGFSAWSSQHEPSQVFTLLQNIYYAFDAEAKRKDVFKVETIGDSYVAVTGLPEPQSDHAVIMLMFALECRKLLRVVTQDLERSLGPAVADLKMRFGLHSGAVTAGVMRGERTRFQLFGDTVHIASRMESTGQPDMIQISDTTAALLMNAGKVDWLRPREDPVPVRGKGDIGTYWIVPADGRSKRRGKFGAFISSAFSLSSSSMSTGEISVDDEPRKPVRRTRSALTKAREGIWGTDDLNGPGGNGNKSQQGKPSDTSRLIDWNVDTLTRLLKLVEGKRRIASSDDDCSESTVETGPRYLDQVALRDRDRDADIVEEVKEIITLPTYDPDFAGTLLNPDHLPLDDEVEQQLRDYVSTIASMYRDNPFHNYEHACHVQMSMIKLLQRVVNPEEIDESSSHADLDMHQYTYGITSDPLTQFTVVFCALIHDVDHTGVTNGQLIKENAHIAAVYKNKSVAEQNSVDLAWDLLMDERYEALRHCIYSTQVEFLRFRQLVVNVVLATDIFDKELSALRKNRWSKAFNEKDYEESSNLKANRKATIVIEHLIQASDVAHTMQHWEIYRKWNERLFYEMYLAFKSGRTDTDPSEGWYKGELWFFDNYVIPLAKKLKECNVFGVSSDECLNYAMENRRLWEMRGEQIVAEMLSTDYYDTLKDKRSKRSVRRNRLLKVT